MLKEFFGIGGYARTPEGFFSWQHIAFVTALMAAMTLTAVIMGRRSRGGSLREKNRALIVAAIAMDTLELIKICVTCLINGDMSALSDMLPLYMCSIQLISLPMAAFSRGRLKEAALDFVCIFGILGAVLGTYAAGNNYSAYPVICFDNVVSGLTHSIAGFSSLYIIITGMSSMKKRNIWICFAIISAFGAAAYIANVLLDTNYMFLMGGDGTPYDIVYSMVNGNSAAYPLTVIALFYAYILAFYGVYSLFRRKTAA